MSGSTKIANAMATDEFDEEATAIENMLDRIQPQYPSLSREELRRLFHKIYDRMASKELAEGDKSL